MQKPTKESIKEWKEIYEEYKSFLHPNLKPAVLVIEYLKDKYPIRENTSKRFTEALIYNIKMNEQLVLKIHDGKELTPIVFIIPNERNASELYKIRDEVYDGSQIIIGIEFETDYFIVEGSDELSDEITAFRGLDMNDINNYYLVANYVRCLKKYNLLENVLNRG